MCITGIIVEFDGRVVLFMKKIMENYKNLQDLLESSPAEPGAGQPVLPASPASPATQIRRYAVSAHYYAPSHVPTL